MLVADGYRYLRSSHPFTNRCCSGDQIDERAGAGVDQGLDLGPVLIRVGIARLSAGQQAAGYDPVAGGGGRDRTRRSQLEGIACIVVHRVT
jgi:hypothetical protein